MKPSTRRVAIASVAAILTGCAAQHGQIETADPDNPTWAIQYQGGIKLRDRTYHVVDLFDVSDADLARVKASGALPIAYFSSQYEDWRPDSNQFAEADLGKPLVPWPGERWVDTQSSNVRSIMLSRLDLAKKRGFHAVDVDNTDFFEHDTGFGASLETGVDYVRFLADEAHARGLKYSLKNSIDLIPMVKDVVDFYQNEEAQQYGEAHRYDDVGPVFNIEYERPERPFRRKGFYSLLKRMDVGAWERRL